jgi:inosine-uridine nucleoside N-ribohydrolase
MNTKTKVIYDTDPGVDDAMALYFALAHPDINVIGITTTFGNVSVQQATANALYLTALAGQTIPVAQGVATPQVIAPGSPPDFIHGRDGLGNLPHRQSFSNVADPRSAAQFIVDMARAHPGEISVVPVGPLGNIAAALNLEPSLPSLVRDVVLMGGAIAEQGNVSPVAEANIWNDPHAADQVFNAGFKLTMVGLDVTHRVTLPLALFERIAKNHAHAATDTLLHAVNFYARFYSSLYSDAAKVQGCYGHDVLAFVYLVAPELFTIESGRIRVACDGLAQGQTIMRRKMIEYPHPGWTSVVPNSNACMTVDAAACSALIEQTLLRPWL